MCVWCVGGRIWCTYVCVWGVVCVWEDVSEEKQRPAWLLHAQDTPSSAATGILVNREFSGNGDGLPSGGNAGYSRADLAVAGT